MESILATTSASSFRTLGCMSSSPIDLYTFRLMRWSQTCSTLTQILLPQLLLRSSGTWIRSLTGDEDRGEELTKYLSLLHVWGGQLSILIYQRDSTLLCLTILSSVYKETLPVVLYIPHQVQFHLHRGFSDCIPAHPDSISILFPGHASLLPLLILFLFLFFYFSLSRDQHIFAHSCYFPISSAWFLSLGMESSCAFRKASLKFYQLSSVLLPLRTISLGILSSNSLRSLNSSSSNSGSWLHSLPGSHSLRSWTQPEHG